MIISLDPGDVARIEIADSDGVFEIRYDKDENGKLQVWTDMPDSTGRSGVIYEENFADEDFPGEEFLEGIPEDEPGHVD